MTVSFRQNLKSALPPEHGSWAFVLEPLLIMVAWRDPSRILLSLTIFLLFLAYRPAVVAFRDLHKRKVYPRTKFFLAFGSFCLSITLAIWIVAARTVALDYSILGYSAGAAVSMFAVFAAIDLRTKPGNLARELMGGLIPLAVLGGGLAIYVQVSRVIVAILSVRGLIGRHDDAGVCRWVSVVGAVVLIGLALWVFGTSPLFLAYAVVALRAVFVAFWRPREILPARIGIWEAVMSLIVVVGWHLMR